MKYRFQIQNFPSCLYENKKLDRKEVVDATSNTGKVLATKNEFYYKDLKVSSVVSRGGYMPGSRTEILYFSIEEAKALQEVGIRLSPQSDNLTDEKQREIFKAIEPRWHYQHEYTKYNVGRDWANADYGMMEKGLYSYWIEIEGQEKVNVFCRKRGDAISEAKQMIEAIG